MPKQYRVLDKQQRIDLPFPSMLVEEVGDWLAVAKEILY